ncbi:hypothetical protein MAIT1_03192 [Magnetofaba australis IT-1]|uniref:Uncharacterized protein n=1 Tax=Magnetofaba australis IT-1 TaxID=1434232 RepID=A0A1Y2K6X4_9PROT|nr:hypothetical protein MAIT1_03192 [Magnetofaba australis IT-1]
MQAEEILYEVDGVRVRVDLPLAENKTPRAVALWRAKRIAFDRLLARLAPQNVLQEQEKAIGEMRNLTDSLVRRVVIQSERYATDSSSFAIVANIAFDREKTRQMLRDNGVLFTDSPMPKVLALVGLSTASGWRYAGKNDPLWRAFSKQARARGLDVAIPLQDVEDLVNLKWGQAMAGDEKTFDWVIKRYGAARIWSVQGQVGEYPQQADQKERRFYAVGRLDAASRGADAVEIKAQSVGSFNSLQEAEQTLLEQLAESLLDQVAKEWMSAQLSGANADAFVDLDVRFGGDLTRYADLECKLRDMAEVRRLEVRGSRWDMAKLRLSLQGEPARLREWLSAQGWRVSEDAEGAWRVQLF